MKKNIRLLSVMMFFTLTTTIALAAKASTPLEPYAPPVHQFEIAPEFSYITYREPSVSVRNNGNFYGLFGSYDFHPYSKNWITAFLDDFHAELHANYGLVTYSGSGRMKSIHDYMIEPRLWAGKNLIMGSFCLTPYAGFGYRLLYDLQGGHTTSTGNWGYDRRSQYLYVPVGFQYMVPVTQGWRVVLNAEYDFLLKGFQNSYFSDMPGYPDILNKQNKGFGTRGSLKIIKDGINFFVEPYIRYWYIHDSNSKTATGSSETITDAYEPRNTSTEIGARVGVQF